MVVDGKLSCRYCSADITRLEPWPAGERREFACPKCGCVNYVTPVVEYRSTTFGREPVAGHQSRGVEARRDRVRR